MQPNLADFDVESGASRGARLELINKFGKRSGEWIDLLGADSKEAQSRIAEQAQSRVERLQRQGARAVFTTDELIDERCDFLAALTKGWSFRAGDEAFPCSADAAKKVYKNSALIREQVEAFVNNRANFLQS